MLSDYYSPYNYIVNCSQYSKRGRDQKLHVGDTGLKTISIVGRNLVGIINYLDTL